MKATIQNAEQSTPDDLLTLQLAYKHDPIVIALIRQVQDNFAIAQYESEIIGNKETEIERLEGIIDELEEKIFRLEAGISEAVFGLAAIRAFKKAEMIENITEIMQELEDLKK